MANKSEVKRSHAFTVYADMGDARSIAGLTKRLKADGYAISRHTLTAWHKADGWDERIGQGDIPARQVPTTPKARKLQGAAMEMAEIAADLTDAEKVKSVVTTLASLTNALAQKAIALIAGAETNDLGDVLSMARAAGDIAKAVSSIHTALNPPIDPAVLTPVNSAPADSSRPPALEDAIARFTQRA